MKLYNVTFDASDTRSYLEPCIPYSVGDGEDKVTPRVCLCDSVVHCIQAIAPVNRNIKEGAHFKIREVEISEYDKNLIYPYELKESEKVPDALENNEYWYLKSIPCEITECNIEDFDYEFTLAWSCISVEQCRDIIERYTDVLKNSLYKDSESMYKDFTKWAYENKQYEMADDVWEELAQLPWAQKTAIISISYYSVGKMQN